jgi:glycosyltransferase involved in cell wall biosynthesis
MHVCIAGSKSCPPRIGGIEVFSFEIGKRLASRGINTTLIASRWPGEPSREEIHGIDVRRVWTLRQRHILKISTLPSLLRVVKAIKIDVFHANDPVSGLVPALVSDVGRSILTIHGLGMSEAEWSFPFRQGGRLLQRVSLAKNTVVTTTDVRTASEFAMFRKDIRVIPTGVDTDAFRRGAHERPACLDGSRTNILFAGRLTAVKGFDILVKSLCELPQEFRDRIRLTVIGDGPLANLLGASGPCGSLVNWLGEIPHERIPPYFTNADLFVMPSRSEGLPISILEAMSSGLPVVTTGVGGISELFDERHFTRIAECSPKAVADAIVRALEDKGTSDARARNARDLVRREYSWDKVADRFLEIYKEPGS